MTKPMASRDNQQLSLFTFLAEAKPTVQIPSSNRRAKPIVKRKRPDAVYGYQLTSKAPTVPVHRVSTRSAAELMQRNARSLRPGVVHKTKGFHGGTLVAVWAGINPEDHRGYLWDIHLEQAG